MKNIILLLILNLFIFVFASCVHGYENGHKIDILTDKEKNMLYEYRQAKSPHLSEFNNLKNYIISNLSPKSSLHDMFHSIILVDLLDEKDQPIFEKNLITRQSYV